jgi:DNA gyrase subunit A
MADVLLNNLFVQTQMQSSFGINMVALVDGQPKLLNLKEVIQAFIRHRQEVVTRRTIYELRKARERAHILEGLGVALTNIDEMIAMIKASGSPVEAKQQLMSKTWSPGIVKGMLEGTGSDASRVEGLAEGYGLLGNEYRLSNAQVDAILELKLHRLTGLEQEKIIEEYRNLLSAIKELLDILADFNRLMQVIRDELIEMRDQFGDARRTVINDSYADVNIEDLIAEEDMAVTLSAEGYIKAQPVSAYQAQHRGGRGKSATSLKEEDIVEKLVVASTHATMLCFSNLGKVYWKKVYEFPQASRASRGRPINNLLPLENGECITAMLPVRQYDAEQFVFMATSAGVVKKTSLEAFSRPRAGGIIALELDEGDKLIGAALTDGKKEVMLFSDGGKAVRFNETNVRSMGRTARGVRGIRLQPKQKVISLLIVPNNEGQILTATERGYGKRTVVSEYRTVNRGAQGVVSIQTTPRNGKVVSAIWVDDAIQVMLITNGGVLVRTRASEISLVGRNTQGVRLINLGNGESLVGVQPVDEIEGIDDSIIEAETDSENAEEAVSE